MNTPNAAEVMAAPNSKRRRALTLLIALFVTAGVAYGVWWSLVGRYRVYTDDAYVSGNLIQVMPRIAGTVIAVAVASPDRVEAGQVLVRLDDADARVALQNATAGLAQTVRQVRQMFEAVKQDQAMVVLQQAQLKQARQDLKRRLGLLAAHSISEEDVAHARTTADTAAAQLKLDQSKLEAARMEVVGVTVATHPAVRQAEARLRDAYLALKRCVIRAPVNGFIAKRSVQVGEQVTPGTAMMAVVPLDNLWVEANVKEDQLNHLRIGQPVTMHSDSFGDDVTFHGTLEGLAAGTGSAFALLPPQNASGNWIKIVQRLPVWVSLDPRELAKHPLRVGLSMNVTIDTHDRHGPVLTKVTPNAPPRYVTDIYAGELQQVNALIQHVISDNDGAAETTADTQPGNR